ncbi:LysR family transcriptional regulator [Salinisphaera sp. RV14]|uniref:LysR family transcriptional regulator n=1 Tax=Salinisphaera sp. RV14 TaxID=3454140 RepID=UPI003F86D6B0
MIERLPLNALRTFAIAARHESFKRAAAELGVTPGAVSRQVKRLEATLGGTLFERGAHGVRLNATGRRLAEHVNGHLAGLATAMAKARQDGGEALSVSVPPSFVQHWLMPRLAGFDAGEAEVAIEASPSLTEPVWQAGRSRLAIRCGPKPALGIEAERLLAAGPPLAQPADLAAHTLLHASWTPGAAATSFPGWREWLDFAGADAVDAPVHRRYSLFSLVLDQAIAGRGVALATHTVVADRLASGVLVAPFGDRYAMPSPFDYWLLRPATGSPPPLAHRFCEWLRLEARAFARSA